MNEYEEELQRNLENGQTPEGDSLDVKAYQEIFRVLKKDVQYKLSDGFAQSVASSVAARREGKVSKDYFWFGAGIFVLALVFLATVLFTGFKLDFGFLTVMSDYKGLAIFGIVFITFLNFLDKRLVKTRQVQ